MFAPAGCSQDSSGEQAGTETTVGTSREALLGEVQENLSFNSLFIVSVLRSGAWGLKTTHAPFTAAQTFPEILKSKIEEAQNHNIS